MKIPTSSSVLLATLAISSSSSSLAAPAGDGPESGLTSSSSSHLIASRYGPISTPRAEGNSNQERSPAADDFQESGLQEVLCGIPIVGPLLGALLPPVCGEPSGAESVNDPQALKEAAISLSNMMSSQMANSSASSADPTSEQSAIPRGELAPDAPPSTSTNTSDPTAPPNTPSAPADDVPLDARDTPSLPVVPVGLPSLPVVTPSLPIGAPSVLTNILPLPTVSSAGASAPSETNTSN
ncbi:hypothetical protein BDZ94DRAFT_14944 [Collybia nuda]|uniref:Uncharacterized protein n=1 Tax=Collybia nuda TaxID=64659 RepID=A0A9P6CPW7_9AGAR|nr:hypothetical protein BDZ94DRAFT_14944 [Collybia nuda]